MNMCIGQKFYHKILGLCQVVGIKRISDIEFYIIRTDTSRNNQMELRITKDHQFIGEVYHDKNKLDSNSHCS